VPCQHIGRVPATAFRLRSEHAPAHRRVTQWRAERQPLIDFQLAIARRVVGVMRHLPQHVVGDDAAGAVRHQHDLLALFERRRNRGPDARADPSAEIALLIPVLTDVGGNPADERAGQSERP
jgi:hypothetical protein